MENPSTYHTFYRKPYTPEDEFSEPSTSSRPITASGYELRPGIIAMVRKESFSGLDILEFKQLEKESIGAACVRFSHLLALIPDWSIPEDVALQIFYSGLDNTSALNLDIAIGGSFVLQTPTEGK